MRVEQISRRRFLVRGGAAAAGLATLRAAALPAKLPATQPTPPAPQPALPAIPAPLGREVYLTRIEATRARMREAGAGALIETPGPNLRYLTGLAIGRSERLIALVLPVEGPPAILGPAFERDLLAASPAGAEELLTWEEDEDPFDALKKRLKKLDLTQSRIAIGGTTWYDDFARIHADMAKLTFVSTTPIIGYLRERKSPQEIALMKAAIDVTDRAIQSALREAREGMREDELAGAISSRIREMGARGDGLVQFGPRSAVPHNPTSDRRLAAGDLILIDFGAEVHGYWSDLSRPAVLGKATGRMKMIHSAIREAQDLALERAKPGAGCHALDQIARAALGGRGFFKFILHRLGHGIGLEGHEPPWLTLRNFEPLAAGHVATLEPGVYTPGDYGIRIEDMMEVTESGALMLSTPPEALIEI